MKRLIILALLLTACTQFHLIVKPPPVTIAPRIAPPTLNGVAWPSLLPTPTEAP